MESGEERQAKVEGWVVGEDWLIGKGRAVVEAWVAVEAQVMMDGRRKGVRASARRCASAFICLQVRSGARWTAGSKAEVWSARAELFGEVGREEVMLGSKTYR